MSRKDKNTEQMHTLKGLKPGSSAVISSVGGEGALRQHFLDMGLIPGTTVTTVKYAPMGDPVEFKVRGYELTLRLDDADKITIDTDAKTTIEEYKAPQMHKTAHPGLGEGGKYHEKGSGLRAPS